MSNKKYKIGYTAGVFDMFHIGHLNILKRAKDYCDFLIVGVSTDELVLENKYKLPIIPFSERVEIVRSIKYVDEVIPQIDYTAKGKIETVIKNKADVIFVGDDWKNTEKWNQIEEELNKVGCDVIYLPRTKHISSSIIRDRLFKD